LHDPADVAAVGSGRRLAELSGYRCEGGALSELIGDLLGTRADRIFVFGAIDGDAFVAGKPCLGDE